MKYDWSPQRRDRHYITDAVLPKVGKFRNFKSIKLNTLGDLLKLTYSNGVRRAMKGLR